MNNNDDFGQYYCVAENLHGRMEAIVLILRMSHLESLGRCLFSSPYRTTSEYKYRTNASTAF